MPADQQQPPPRRIGLVGAVSIVVASMIGAGVFTTAGLLVEDLGSPIAVLAAWALGGLLALSGALCYAELGAALPRNGGEYQLLSRIYHPAVGFVAGWVSFIVGFSAPLAAVALAFGHYTERVAPGVPPTAAALTAIGALSVVHAARVSVGTRVQSAITIVQVLLIVVFIVGGFWSGAPERLLDADPVRLGGAMLSPAFAVGLIYVLFSYSGWNAAAYIAGEIEQPGRTLPRALFLGAGLVTCLYVGINAVFLMAAPTEELAGIVEVGHVAAVRLFGPAGGHAMSAVIALGLLANIGALLMTGSRVYEQVGRDYPRLRVLASRSARSGPISAVVLQATAAAVMALSASFEGLLTYIGFTLSLTALLTVAGVFVLRRREPSLARPYRTWGYPLTPLFACAVFLWLVVHTVHERPVAPLAGLGTLAAGFALYLLVRRPTGSGAGRLFAAWR